MPILLRVLVLLLLTAAPGWGASFLFDATHAETAGNADWVIDQDSSPQRFPTPDQATVTASTTETYWTGAISAWGIEMVKRGHHVETLPVGTAITYLNSSNAQDLSHYQVFVVDEPNKVFTAAEQAAIVNFVNAGGGLFIIGDHAGSDRDGDGKDSVAVWNELSANNSVQAAPFGIVFNSVSISPTTETADTSLDNPITHGVAGTVTQFAYHSGSSLTIDPTKNPSVRGAVWTTSSQTNANVMVAYGTFGAGKFVATGDSSPIDDGSGASGNTLFDGWDEVDDARLIINASLWLASATTAGPPPNDNFASAIIISGTTVSAAGTNVNATKETGEPNHAGDLGGRSIWWKWTAPSSGDVVIETNGSTFDTLLAVYTGNAVSALTEIASDNNGGPSLTSQVTFAATAGVVYEIAVDGAGGASGNAQLSLTLSVPASPGIATIASWNFDSPPYGNPLGASAGAGSIDFTGWHGMVTNFNGVGGTQALALQGTAGNDTYIEIDFSMSGFRALNISFATRGTANGYNSGLWSWSANGGAFTTLAGVNTATRATTFSTKMVDFTDATALNNAATVRLRYTLSGATGSEQNNRIDDLVVSATRTPTITAIVNNADAYEQGMQPASVTISSSLVADTGGLPVQFQLGGSALAGTDYSLSGNSAPGVATIPAGATSVTLTITPLADNDPTEFDETATVALQSNAVYFLGAQNSASIVIHDDTPYNSTWAAQFPGFSGPSAAPEIDLEGDGISNFLEFAFNGDPLHSDRGILPVIGKIDLPDSTDGAAFNTYPTITFTRRTDAPELDYSVETSLDLVQWTNDVEQVSAVPGATANTEVVTYRANSPLTGSAAVPAIFLRVGVSIEERPPPIRLKSIRR